METQKSGSWAELERLVDHPLLQSPCQHHIYDLAEKLAYRKLFGAARGPTNSEFEHFQSKFRRLNLAEAEP